MTDPAPTDLRARLLECLALKDAPRRGWQRAGIARPESVAAHSWGVAWLVLALLPDGLDRDRALALAVLHDLAEARTGDLLPGERDDKADAERAAFAHLTDALPPARRDALRALQRDYADRGSPEARFVKACDLLDMALQATRYADSPEHSDAADAPDTREFVDSALAGLDDPHLRALAGDPA